MTHVDVELPENVFSVLQCFKQKTAPSRRPLVSVRANLTRSGCRDRWPGSYGFFTALAKVSKDSFQVDFEDLDCELNRG